MYICVYVCVCVFTYRRIHFALDAMPVAHAMMTHVAHLEGVHILRLLAIGGATGNLHAQKNL